MSTENTVDQAPSRRDFVKGTAALGAGSVAGLAMPVWGSIPASGRMKVGLVGCGGRGTGAANQAINADSGVLLWAMGDVYSDRLQGSLNGLKQQHGNPEEDEAESDRARDMVGHPALK